MPARRRLGHLLGPWLLLAGCHIASAKDTGLREMNACQTTMDCDKGSVCQDGLCVAESADTPLQIMLQVTPAHGSAGNDPVPVTYDRFVVRGRLTRSFALPGRTTLTGHVQSGGMPIDAQLTFTPVLMIPSVAAKSVSASVVADDPSGGGDFSVELASDTQYRLLVRPKDTSFPPFHRMLVAGRDKTADVDIDTAADVESFTISGVPDDRMVLVRAIDPASGEQLSSTATLMGPGSVQLSFGPESTSYLLEIQAAQKYQGGAVADDSAPCNDDTPAFPVFRFDPKDLTLAPDGTTQVVLPSQPPRIRFEGTVDLCPAEKANAAKVGTLPLTLHAQSLLSVDPTTASAQFDASTEASYDPATGQLRFCAQVMPGDYDVVVSPPPSVQCALFAERRLIQAPDGKVASGTLLELPSASYLKGTVQTELAPIPGAAVEAVALGRSEGIDLPADQQSATRYVTRYNRSQQTTTNAAGEFKLAVDLGSYDVVIKPPTDSGFPWQIRHDVTIGVQNSAPFWTTIGMLAPVALTGALTSKAGDAAAAQVEAFAVIPVMPSGERAVLVGKASADENGRFTLLLPPTTHRGW